jgi:osmotically-inducible protein OsmY
MAMRRWALVTVFAARQYTRKGRSIMAVTVVDNVQPRAKAALVGSPFYELRALQVEYRDGTLLLSGHVSSFYHKQLAQEVVRAVCEGVKLVNSVQVECLDDFE